MRSIDGGVNSADYLDSYDLRKMTYKQAYLEVGFEFADETTSN